MRGRVITADSALRALQGCYLARPVAFLPELPNTGISLTRWRRTESGPSHLVRHPQTFYTLSLILRPMRGRAWAGSALVWSGAVGANTIRLTPPGMEPSWRQSEEFDFLLFTIPAETIDRIAGDEAYEFTQRCDGLFRCMGGMRLFCSSPAICWRPLTVERLCPAIRQRRWTGVFTRCPSTRPLRRREARMSPDVWGSARTACDGYVSSFSGHWPSRFRSRIWPPWRV